MHCVPIHSLPCWSPSNSSSWDLFHESSSKLFAPTTHHQAERWGFLAPSGMEGLTKKEHGTSHPILLSLWVIPSHSSIGKKNSDNNKLTFQWFVRTCQFLFVCLKTSLLYSLLCESFYVKEGKLTQTPRLSLAWLCLSARLSCSDQRTMLGQESLTMCSQYNGNRHCRADPIMGWLACSG